MGVILLDHGASPYHQPPQVRRTDRELALDAESRHSSPLRPRRSPAGVAAAVELDEPARALALEQRIAELERELAQMRGREAGWRTERGRLVAALEAAEREV